MGMKKFIASDNKAAWYDDNKHDLVEGQLVLKSEYNGIPKQPEPAVKAKPVVKESKKSSRRTKY